MITAVRVFVTSPSGPLTTIDILTGAVIDPLVIGQSAVGHRAVGVDLGAIPERDGLDEALERLFIRVVNHLCGHLSRGPVLCPDDGRLTHRPTGWTTFSMTDVLNMS